MERMRLERLFRQGEGVALDYKRDQYLFEREADAVKAKLLKDILAFANAIRQDDAFILVGVDEDVNKSGVPVGVTQHIDDAKLQQFVNSKTNRPIEFSYTTIDYDGMSIGVFRIPRQTRRPFILNAAFGGLDAGVVYMRRGTTTVRATVDDIAEMGRDDVIGEKAAAEAQRAAQLVDDLRRGELNLSPYKVPPGRRYIWKSPPDWHPHEDTHDLRIATKEEVFWLNFAIWRDLPDYRPSSTAPRGFPPDSLFIYETDIEARARRKVRCDNNEGFVYMALTKRNESPPDMCLRHFRWLPNNAINCGECGLEVKDVRVNNEEILAKMRAALCVE